MTKLDAPNCKVRVPLPLSTHVPFRGNKIIKVQVRPHINVLYNKMYHIGLDNFVLYLRYTRSRKKRNQKVSNWTLLKQKLQNTWCVIHLYSTSPTHVYLSVGISRTPCNDYSFLFTKTNLCSLAVGFAFDIM